MFRQWTRINHRPVSAHGFLWPHGYLYWNLPSFLRQHLLSFFLYQIVSSVYMCEYCFFFTLTTKTRHFNHLNARISLQGKGRMLCRRPRKECSRVTSIISSSIALVLITKPSIHVNGVRIHIHHLFFSCSNYQQQFEMPVSRNYWYRIWGPHRHVN